MSVDQEFIDVQEISSPTENVELAVRHAHVVGRVAKHKRVVTRRCDLMLMNDLQTDWSLSVVVTSREKNFVYLLMKIRSRRAQMHTTRQNQ